MIRAGVLILLFVAYQLWGTGLQTERAQSSLRQQLVFRKRRRAWHAGLDLPCLRRPNSLCLIRATNRPFYSRSPSFANLIASKKMIYI